MQINKKVAVDFISQYNSSAYYGMILFTTAKARLIFLIEHNKISGALRVVPCIIISHVLGSLHCKNLKSHFITFKQFI